jgi:hypothetical protein
MGYDLVTWAPAIGGGGADKYDPPASSTINYGDTSGFSATPTIAQLNATSGINQVIGLYNRRALNCNALTGSALATQAYLGGNRVRASDLTTLRTRINTMRAAEGFAAYSFVAPLAANGTITGAVIAELRASLRIAGTMTVVRGAANKGYYSRFHSAGGYPGGSSSINISNVDATDNIGKTYSPPTSGTILRERRLFSVPIPDYVTSLTSASFDVTFGSVNTSLEAVDILLYTSNTDDHLYDDTAHGTNIDNFIDSILAPTATAYSITVPDAEFTAAAGRYLSFILISAHDSTSDGAGGSGGSALGSSANVSVDETVIINFGS